MNPEVRNFYRHRVPDQWNRSLEAQSQRATSDEPARLLLEAMQRVDATLDVIVERGPNRQHYSLDIDRGRMTCNETSQRDPFLVLVHDLETF